MPWLRALVGPSIMGIAAWCAAGDVTVTTPGDALARLVAPASWWWLVAGAGVGAIVRGWRETPLLATPALLAVVPWLPVPLPAVALIWTGPLAWLPLGLAMFAAAVPSTFDRKLGTRSAGLSAHADGPAAVAALWGPALAAGALTLVAALLTFWSVHPRLPGGDEPSYLVITQSLLTDGDLRIENNHARRDYAAYYAGNLRPDFIQRGRDGQIYSIHAPGISAVVLPAFAAFGYAGAVGTVSLIAAFTGAIVWMIGFIATDDRKAAWVAWASVTLSTTFLIQSITIFPDGPGAFVVAASIWLVLAMRLAPERIATSRIVVVSALLAGLPWLHTRFSVLAAGFGLLIVGQILTDASRPSAQRGWRVIAFSIVPAVSAALWFLFFQLTYGTPDPSAPYGPDPGTRLTYVPGGLIALAFDQRFGLLVASPVLAAGAAGLWAWGRRLTPIARVVGAVRVAAIVALVYAAATATYWMWWGGQPVTPARFLAAILPVFAAPIAIAWARGSIAVRAWTALLLALSISMTAVLIGVERGELAWNVRDTAARWLEWAGPVADLARAWPSFFWVLRPEDLRTEWPFAIHAAMWAAIFAVAIGGVAWRARSTDARPAAVALNVAWAFAVALMLAISLGWRHTGQPPLNPTQSQLSALRAMADGAPVSRVSAWDVRRVTQPGGVVIAPQRRGQVFVRAPEWALLTDVPAGDYELRVVQAAPVAGELVVKLGRSPKPYRTLPLQAVSEQRFTLPLAGGARVLTIEPGPPSVSVDGRVELRPVALLSEPMGVAVSAASYGAMDVFFLNDAAFAEDDGFWVRGGQEAAFAVFDPGGRAAIEIDLGNGSAANTVRVTAGAIDETLSLAPQESRTIRIPLFERRARVRVESSAGFRPSDTGGSEDRRYLGVRVVVR